MRAVFRQIIRMAAWSALPLAVALAAQPAGPTTAAEFFSSGKVYTFHLNVDADNFSRMQPPGGPGGRGGRGGPGMPFGGQEYPKVTARLEFEGKDLGAISVRYKGNTSYMGAGELKRPLKLEFDEPDKNKTFLGLKKLNLNNNAMDSSQIRESLGYEVFRRAGVPAPRTAFARVYLTVPGTYAKRYAGLYTVVEQVDQTFLKDRFGRQAGLLLKPEMLNGLPDLGDGWNAYKNRYSEKIKADPADAKRFIAFVRLVNQASDEEFAGRIGEFLDVDLFLRFLAVETVIMNLDSPLAMNHNYYLTVHPETHRVVWIPWDLNLAFGGFGGGDSTNLSVRKPFAPGQFRLAERILAAPGRMKEYERIVRDLVTANFTEQRMGERIAALEAAIRNAVNDEDRDGATASRGGRGFPGPGRGGFQIPQGGFAISPSDGRGGPPEGFDGGAGMPGMGGPALSSEYVSKRVRSVLEQLDGKREGSAPPGPPSGMGGRGAPPWGAPGRE